VLIFIVVVLFMVKRSSAQVDTSAKKGCHIHQQMPASGRALIFKLRPVKTCGLDIGRMELDGGVRLPGQKYLRCNKEYMAVIVGGKIVPLLYGEIIVMAGGFLAFKGGQPHSYQNGGCDLARTVSVVFVPLGWI
jgi:hypothetical protein